MTYKQQNKSNYNNSDNVTYLYYQFTRNTLLDDNALILQLVRNCDKQ